MRVLGYSQIIVDAHAWIQNLPHTIGAFFYVRGSSEANVGWAKWAHTEFHKVYPGAEAPLVSLDLGDWDNPFRTAAW